MAISSQSKPNIVDLKATYDHLEGQARQVLVYRAQVIRDWETEQRTRFRSRNAWLIVPGGAFILLGLATAIRNPAGGLPFAVLGVAMLAIGIRMESQLQARKRAAGSQIAQHLAEIDTRLAEIRRQQARISSEIEQSV